MKWLILLLFPLMSFGQWEYKEVIDSVGKDIYSIATNKNLSIVHDYEDLTMGVEVEQDKHVRDGYIAIKMVFITETMDYTYTTTGRCYEGFVTITTALHTQQFLKYLKIATKVEIQLQVKTNVMWLTYCYDSSNFNQAYDFIIKH